MWSWDVPGPFEWRYNMTALTRRQDVIDKYAEIIGRNIYSQSLRDYCYKPYKDGNYYSDCSSSICYAYKEAGQGFGITNTAGMYTAAELSTVDGDILQGIPDTSRLRPGDMLLFAGTDASRPKRIGHVEMYCGNGIICGHGSGRPSYKDLTAYCRSRYNSWASGGWRKGLVCVRRYIQDGPMGPGAFTWATPGIQLRIAGTWMRTGSGIGSTVPALWYPTHGIGIKVTGII